MKMHLCLALLLLWSWPALAAVSAANRVASGATTCTSPQYATISVTANDLVLVSIHSALSSGNGADVATVDGSGAGLTFTQVATQLFGATQGTGKVDRISVFRALVPSTTAGAIIAINWPQSQSRCEWVADELSGVDTSGSNGSGAIVQSPSAAGGSAQPSTLTMGAFSNANNATYSTTAIHLAQTLSAGTSMTRLGFYAGAWSIGTEFAAGNVSPVTMNWNATSTSWGIIGIEVKVAGGAGGVRRRRVQVLQ